MLKLYDYFRSSACFRVRIALNLKELDYQTIPVHLVNHGGEQFFDAYKKINPQSLVPSLEDGNHVLTQSLAIIEYLDETHSNFPLLPKNSLERALIRAFALTITADLHPLNNLRVLNYLTGELKLSEEKKMEWYHHWMHKGLQALEAQLIKHQLTGNFCFGDTPTLADICLVPQMYNARRFACKLDAYPTLVKIDKHCQQISSILNAFPSEEKQEAYAKN